MNDQPSVLQPRIDAMMAQLTSEEPAERREAAYFLGEAAEADAVPALIELYRRDPDASVRKAAGYVLGMFRAVEQALQTDQAYVVGLLENVTEGKLGRRGGRGIVRVEIGLLVAFLILGLVALLRDDVRALVFPSATDRATLLEAVRGQYALVNNDARTLQTQYIALLSAQTLSCNDFFNEVGALSINAADARAHSDIASIVTRLNQARANWQQAKALYDRVCNEDETPEPELVGETFRTHLSPALTTLTEIELDFAAAQAVRIIPTDAPQVAPPVEQPPDAPPAEQPTASPTEAGLPLQLQPTIDPALIVGANPSRHVPTLFMLIDDVTSPRGAGSLLLRYWQDVEQTGSTEGCRAPAPPIPARDVFIEQVDLLASPDLRDAVTLIDSGLTTLRRGWVNFQQACNSGGLRDQLARGIADARLAVTAFDTASSLLLAVREQ